MRKEDLFDVFNTSVPDYTGLELVLYDLTLGTSYSKVSAIDAERKMIDLNEKFISKVIGSRKALSRTGALARMPFITDVKNSTSCIRFDDEQLLLNMFNMLSSLTREDFDKQIFVDKLNSIRVTIDLLQQHKVYEANNFMRNDLRTLMYNNFSSTTSVDYLSNMLDYYEAILDNMNDIKNNLNEELLSEYMEELNPRKLGLFLASNYLKKATIAARKNNIFEAQRNLFYVSSYLNNVKNMGASLNSVNGFIQTYDILMKKYKELLIKYPDLQDLLYERDMFINRTKEQNEGIISNIINMKHKKINKSIIKSGHVEPSVPTGITRTRKEVTEMDLKEIKRVIMDRELYYLSYGPIARFEGKGEFSNYLCYLYSNGIVVTDRLLNINTLSGTESDAIYVFNASNFETLIGLDKQVLRTIIPSKRHNDTWKSRVEKIITQETSEELKEKAKVLKQKKEQ